ncbi:MAG: OmpA family protein [Candidatus Omnitrophica bacterium]|nr:OmpA family protein [Candidatus Omnitrophota bacterium]
MFKPLTKTIAIISILCFALTQSGCTFIFQKGRRVDIEKISKLKSEVDDLTQQMSELERAKKELEDRLKNEISDKEVKVEMLEKGLVITFVSEVLFDSGKAELRTEAFSRMDKVASVIQTTVKDMNIGIEGHTDNDPIKYSGWKSNWELSTGRALSVLHYLSDKQGVDPARLSATGYGEFKPVASNDIASGKQKNRRVEIVILPDVTKEGR